MSLSFDRVAGLYDASRPLPPEAAERVADAVLALTGATAETRLLEIGVGTGRIALPLARRGCRLTGVDISREMLAEFRRKLGADAPNVEPVEADAAALPFPDGSFAAALAVHVFHLIPAWRAALAEVRRVLRPGGVLLLGREEHEPSAALRELNAEWARILAECGVEVSRSRLRTAELASTLVEQGAELETVTAARWRSTIALGDLLELYDRKVYSEWWAIPDDVFAGAARDLRAWAGRRYPSGDAALERESAFVLVAARHWTSV